MSMYITLIGLVVFLSVSLCGFWLFTQRESYQRWYYFAYGLLFSALILTLFIPKYLLHVGVLLLMVTAGQVITNAINEWHLKHRMDLPNGRLILR